MKTLKISLAHRSSWYVPISPVFGSNVRISPSDSNSTNFWFIFFLARCQIFRVGRSQSETPPGPESTRWCAQNLISESKNSTLTKASPFIASMVSDWCVIWSLLKPFETDPPPPWCPEHHMALQLRHRRTHQTSDVWRCVSLSTLSRFLSIFLRRAFEAPRHTSALFRLILALPLVCKSILFVWLYIHAFDMLFFCLSLSLLFTVALSSFTDFILSPFKIIHLNLAKMCVGFYFLSFLQRFFFNLVPALCDCLCPLYVFLWALYSKVGKHCIHFASRCGPNLLFLFDFYLSSKSCVTFVCVLNKDTYILKTSMF